MKRIWMIFLAPMLLVGLITGCGGPAEQSAPKTEIRVQTPQTEEEKARQAQLQQQMTAAVRKSTDGKWASAPAEDHQPFLDFHKGDEKAAQQHFETLVQNQLEIDANLAGQ